MSFAVDQTFATYARTSALLLVCCQQTGTAAPPQKAQTDVRGASHKFIFFGLFSQTDAIIKIEINSTDVMTELDRDFFWLHVAPLLRKDVVLALAATRGGENFYQQIMTTCADEFLRRKYKQRDLVPQQPEASRNSNRDIALVAMQAHAFMHEFAMKAVHLLVSEAAVGGGAEDK